MQRTENLKLGLWEGTDFPNYTMPNENMNTLDTVIKEVQTKVAGNIESIEDLNIESANIKTEFTNFNSEQNEKNTDFSEKISENAQSIEYLDDTLTTVNTNVNNLTNTVNTNSKDISNIESDVALIKSDAQNKFTCLISNTIAGGDCTVDTLISKVLPAWLSIDTDKKIHLKNDNDKYLIKFTGYIEVTSRTGVLKSVIATGVETTKQITNDINCVDFINQRIITFTSVNDTVTMPRYTIDNSTNNIAFKNCELEISRLN